jgi:type II secretion system protein N
VTVDWTRWRPRLLYGGFALLAFALSLRWTFPAEAMKERLIMEAGKRGWQIDMERVSAGGLLGITAHGVKLETGSGLAVPLDELTASVRLLPLLVGRRSVAFDAVVYDGRVRGHADLSGEPRNLTLDIQGVDLGRALPLRKAAGMDLLGKVSGTADLSLPAAGEQRMTGRVEATVKEAGLASGQLPVPGMTSGLNLPKMSFGTVAANLKVGDGKATFEKLEATGGDAELRTDGVYFVVQPRMEFAPVSGKARLKVADAFWARGGNQAFKGLAEAALASAKGSDGSWNFSVTGSVGHPRLQPTAPGR